MTSFEGIRKEDADIIAIYEQYLVALKKSSQSDITTLVKMARHRWGSGWENKAVKTAKKYKYKFKY